MSIKRYSSVESQKLPDMTEGAAFFITSFRDDHGHWIGGQIIRSKSTGVLALESIVQMQAVVMAKMDYVDLINYTVMPVCRLEKEVN